MCNCYTYLPDAYERSVNIIGRGKGWDDAPVGEYSWGITLINLSRKVDLVIDMNVYEDGRWGEDERVQATKSKMLAMSEGVPYVDLDSYPLRQVIEHFKSDYFTSTVDYALALSIYRQFTTINLYGVNMASMSEYAYQKPGAEFWIGVAKGNGITVNVHGGINTSLMKTQDCMLYGYGIPQKLNTISTGR